MKINKYINAFIATAILAVGTASCTNDDTVDSKANYTIDFVTTGLDEDQQAAFMEVVNKATFNEDVEEIDRVTYGLYSSRDYAQARYNELANSQVIDSIVNAYADQSNIIEYSVNVVLKEGDNVIAQGITKAPTVTRNNYTLSVEQNNGSLDAATVQQLADAATEVYGVAPGNTIPVVSTPKYAATHYLETLAASLREKMTALVPEPDIIEDFSETISLKAGEDVQSVVLYPVCDYVVRYTYNKGSLDETQEGELKKVINQTLFNAATIDHSFYDKRSEECDRAIATKKYNDFMQNNNYAFQNKINEFAGNAEIVDFDITVWLSAGSMFDDAWFADITSKKYAPNIEKDNYKIVYELAAGSLSSEYEAELKECLNKVTDPAAHELNDKYEVKALATYNNFIENEMYEDVAAGASVRINKLAQHFAKKSMTLDFVITFKLVDSKNTVIAKNIFNAAEGWKLGE